MATTSVVGKFRVGFIASPEFDELNDADKQSFKDLIIVETKAKIGLTDRNMFNTHAIAVDDVTGHASEATIQAVVDGILAGFTYTLPCTLVRDTMAGVRYAVWNNTRECIHDYYLDIVDDGTGNRQDWEVSYTYGSVRVEVQLYCAFSWDWPVP